MIKFKDFDYAPAARSFVVDGDVYNTNNLELDDIRDKLNAVASEEAKEEARLQKQKLQAHMGTTEVADTDFKTFAVFEDRMFMLLVNSKVGVAKCFKVNKKRPPKFKGHECNRISGPGLFEHA